jgi:hypothetical protein
MEGGHEMRRLEFVRMAGWLAGWLVGMGVAHGFMIRENIYIYMVG